MLVHALQIMLFNHISYLDSFGLVGLCAPSGVSKESNAGIPVLGRCVRALQNIYVPDHRQVIKAGKKGAATEGVSFSQLIVNQ